MVIRTVGATKAREGQLEEGLKVRVKSVEEDRNEKV